MNTLAERLTWARERLGLSQQEVADLAGVSQGTIANLETGFRRNPRELLAIAKAVKVSAEWMKTGKGNIEPITLSEIPSSTGRKHSDTTTVRAPVVAWARLGEDVLKEAVELAAAQHFEFVPTAPVGTCVKLVPVVDDSLAPRLASGDHVAIDPRNQAARRGQVVLVRSSIDGQFFLRRYQPLIAPCFEVVDSKGNALDSEKHGLEVVGVCVGVVLADI